ELGDRIERELPGITLVRHELLHDRQRACGRSFVRVRQRAEYGRRVVEPVLAEELAHLDVQAQTVIEASIELEHHSAIEDHGRVALLHTEQPALALLRAVDQASQLPRSRALELAPP